MVRSAWCDLWLIVRPPHFSLRGTHLMISGSQSPHHTSHAISQKAPLQRTVIFLQVSGSECLIFSLLPNGLSAALIFRQLHEYYLILESNVFLPLFWPELVGSLVNFGVKSVRGKNLA